MNREKWLKGLKLAVGAVLAITLAELLGLKYSSTAGIITILSIQNTKKETLQVAARRGEAFLCAVAVAAVCFHLLGFTIPAFAVYLFCFSCICLRFRWLEAISTDSVLISHLLTEQSMAPELLLNETLLFLIGAGFGVLINLHLHGKKGEFEVLADQSDQLMRDALRLVRGQLTDEVDSEDVAEGLKRLDESLLKLQECAHRNWNNTLFYPSAYETDYADMRSGQAIVLRHISSCEELLERIPKQAEKVAKLLERVEAEYTRENTVESLLDHMEEVYAYMRQEHLPVTREEFESRAVLFYVLKQIEEFLRIKREFILKKEKM